MCGEEVVTFLYCTCLAAVAEKKIPIFSSVEELYREICVSDREREREKERKGGRERRRERKRKNERVERERERGSERVRERVREREKEIDR